MTVRSHPRGLVLLWVCLMLADCGIAAHRRDASVSDALPLPVQESQTMRQLRGQDPRQAPLQPEPGDIWAGVVPTAPPEALTPPRSGGSSVSAMHEAAISVEPPHPVRPHHPAPPSGLATSSDAPAVQLAAADSAQGAVVAWTKLQHRLRESLRGHSPQVVEAEIDGRKIWRLRAGGFATIAEARAFCTKVRATKADCWVVPR